MLTGSFGVNENVLSILHVYILRLHFHWVFMIFKLCRFNMKGRRRNIIKLTLFTYFVVELNISDQNIIHNFNQGLALNFVND